jgi:hypothetical protein
LTHNPEDEHWEEITQHHGTTVQKICLLNMKTALQLTKSFSVVSLLAGKQQPCRYASHIFHCGVLPVCHFLGQRQEA